MKLLSRFNVSRDGNNGPRKFSIEVTMPGVLSVGLVVLLGMCWIFILGILLGRGYKPESAVPQLAQMMPTTEAAKLADEAAAPPKVLKPEDLTFMDGLQDKGKDGEVVADSTHQGPSEPKKLPPTTLKSRDLTDAKPVAAAPQAAPVPAKAPPPRPAAVEDSARATAAPDPKSPFDKKSGTRYQATYQVASFPGREQADAMAKKLAAKGIIATVHEAKSNNRAVFRVNIQLRGTEADITSSLKKSGEKGPILLEKKPL